MRAGSSRIHLSDEGRQLVDRIAFSALPWLTSTFRSLYDWFLSIFPFWGRGGGWMGVLYFSFCVHEFHYKYFGMFMQREQRSNL